MARQFAYDYYTINVPGDLADNLEDLGSHAIYAAKMQSKLYVIPAEWTAERVSGEVGDFEVEFKVRRKRYKNPK